MQVIRGYKRALKSPCVATIGNFDGMHVAHQAILQQLKQAARERDLPSTVIVFEPQPGEFFSQNAMPARLMSFREKALFLKDNGIERLICLPFNTALSQLTPYQFIDDVLMDALQITWLIVGDDFRFGAKRAGDPHLLQTYSQGRFDCCIFPAYEDQIGRVSSTRIRKALKIGDFDHVRTLLQRDFSLTGRVIRGQQRGRQIGVPTANIGLGRVLSPILGVHIVTAQLGDKRYRAVANIGNRPTVDGTRCLLEIHLLDFDSEIYGQTMTVFFLKKLRDEERYTSIDALKQQIHCDVSNAKAFFTKKGMIDDRL